METYYTTQVIEQITTRFLPLFQRISPNDAAYTANLLNILESGVKFRLPDAGDLLGIERKNRKLSISDVDILHMPYPATVLEYTFAPDKQTLPLGGDRFISSRRITLVVDIPAGENQSSIFSAMTANVPNFSSQGGLVIAGYWSNNDDVVSVVGRSDLCEWEMSAAVAIIPRDQDRVYQRERLQDSHISKVDELKIFFKVTMPLIVGAHEKRIGVTATQQTITRDLEDDINVVWDFMLALSCNNVSINAAEGASRSKLNRKRLAHNKVPFFEYKELHIQGSKLDPSSQQASERVITATGRSAPRMHLRRGHMRNLGPGRRTWVNMAIIGSSSNGRIDKDYVVDASIGMRPK
jgi:hypothetical protein